MRKCVHGIARQWTLAEEPVSLTLSRDDEEEDEGGGGLGRV